MKKSTIISLAIASLLTIGLFLACSSEGEEEAEEESGSCPPPKGAALDTTLAASSQCLPKGGGGSSSTVTGTEGSSGSTSGSCDLTANTTATSTENIYGCSQLSRDTSSCQSDREAQGLSGFWLKFSCTVTLTKDGDSVTLTSDNLPDYKSYYFSASDACFDSFSSTVRSSNPNQIASQTISMTVPYSPSVASSSTATPEGVIGMALNGIAIYDNSAAPGDDIYDEEATFDRCDGHPDVSSRYHYHTEPGPISNSDSGFVGILRDGFPVYGRYDYSTGTTVTGLDSQGGKTSTTVDSTSTAVYHYHINLQSNGTDSAYFISAGAYSGTPGNCTGCQ